MNKYKIFLSVLLVISALLGMFGHTRTGQAQSQNEWSQPVNLSSSGSAANPVAVVDSRGTIHVIWVDAITEGYKYSHSEDGIQWSVPVTVAFPFDSKDPVPFLMADNAGAIHIFWITSRSELYYGQTTSDGFGNPSVWTKSLLSRSASNFEVVADSSGILHLAYIQNVSDEKGPAGVYYRQSISGGGFWSESTSIYQSEYFRGTTAQTSYVRVAVSEQPSKKVFISWDNRPLKRVFIANSGDAGQTWSAAQQFKGPDDTKGFESPFNGSVWASGENLLLMWQEGEPGASKCTVYSQWSKDGGTTWDTPIVLIGGSTACPLSIRFVLVQNDKVAVLLNDLADPLLVAWNGSQWSKPQSQVRLPSLLNPATHDVIFLSCRQDIFYEDQLFVLGCDQGQGRDIWMLSRRLPSMDTWFSPSSIWDDPMHEEIVDQQVSFLSSATDNSGNLHVVWAQSSTVTGSANHSIVELRWAGDEWIGPETIIQKLDGQPLQLTMYADSQNRLMIAWVNGSNGDLLFSSANLDQAILPSGWMESTVVPSPSQLTSSPDIVVDSTGRIVVAYAVPLNENRGIYVVQSTDNGVTWSPYIQAFDAVAAEWDSVDSPKIALSGDGILHLLFTRKALHIGQPAGLYYSQSRDGGVTWSNPLIVSESAISWSDIVTYDSQTVHRLWQENNGLVVANISQVSEDGGATWGKLLDVTNVSEQAPSVALAANGTTGMYFIQLEKESVPGIANQEKLTLQDWKWDRNAWTPGAARDLSIEGRGGNYLLTAGITSQNHLSVSVSAEYVDPKGARRKEMINFSRFLADPTDQGVYVSAVIPVPVFPSAVTSSLSSQAPTSTPIVDRSVLFDSNDPSEGVARNLVGAGLISVAIIIVVLILTRRSPQKKISEHEAD